MVVPVFVKRGGLMPLDSRNAFRVHRSKSNGPVTTMAWRSTGAGVSENCEARSISVFASVQQTRAETCRGCQRTAFQMKARAVEESTVIRSHSLASLARAGKTQ
jgi:hypothetical protein